MDWMKPESAGRVVIAAARLRAKNVTDYKGSMFFNPGVRQSYQTLAACN